jgi:uncharacterized protein YneF (UPF0154 family)
MSLLVQIILLVVFSLVAAVGAFLIAYFVITLRGKKMLKQHGGFNEEQARSMYIMYRQKNPTDNQIKAMIDAYKANK